MSNICESELWLAVMQNERNKIEEVRLPQIKCPFIKLISLLYRKRDIMHFMHVLNNRYQL